MEIPVKSQFVEKEVLTWEVFQTFTVVHILLKSEGKCMSKKWKRVKALASIAIAAMMVFAVSITAFAGDASGVTASISDIIKNQNPDGGWKKDYKKSSGDWAKSTIDNKATYTEIRKLAADFQKNQNGQSKDCCMEGINFLLNMQYSNGGWPQIYGTTKEIYHMYITYNDDAMINVMILLDEISNKSGDFSWVDDTTAQRCRDAVAKGVDCILKTQVQVNGTLTIWGQQHNQNTLQPAEARAYEIPSLCANESTTIVKFLQTRNETAEIRNSINAAKAWFENAKITGIRVEKVYDSSGKKVIDTKVVNDPSAPAIWARFYELGTNTPIFVGRDGIAKYNLSDIEQERRAGYSWYGNWATKNLGIH